MISAPRSGVIVVEASWVCEQADDEPVGERIDHAEFNLHAGIHLWPHSSTTGVPMRESTEVLASVDESEAMSRVDAAIADIAAGRPVVVTDHPERENEGDLVIAAEDATASVIAFMMTQCRGLICAPLTAERAQALELPPMVVRNSEALRTAFTVSVDAARGVTTGISATDRAVAVAVLVDPDAESSDLVRPGHLFPLVAAAGGVLERAGHTEAAIDLALLAGKRPAGVICEIAGDDGEMLRGQSLRDFAHTHGLVQISIAELVRYREA